MVPLLRVRSHDPVSDNPGARKVAGLDEEHQCACDSASKHCKAHILENKACISLTPVPVMFINVGSRRWRVASGR
jgi:hypothetical protein